MFREKCKPHPQRPSAVNNTNPPKKKKSRLVINAEYALFVAVTSLVRLLPLHAAYAVLDFIAWSVRHFSKRHGPRTPRLILHSGFVKTKAEADKLALESLKHFARVYVEMVKFDQIVNEDNFSEHIRIADILDGAHHDVVIERLLIEDDVRADHADDRAFRQLGARGRPAQLHHQTAHDEHHASAGEPEDRALRLRPPLPLSAQKFFERPGCASTDPGAQGRGERHDRVRPARSSAGGR